MYWTKAVKDAVEYMERHITEDITMYDVASHINISPFYFHKGFSILCGYSVTEFVNLIERWLYDGLQNYKKRSIYHFDGNKRIPL